MKPGDVIAWIIIDPDTGEQVMRCKSRDEARMFARDTGGRIAKLVVAK